MRVGNSSSASYRKVHAARHRRKAAVTNRLCVRLDRLVIRAERLHSGKTRAGLLTRAAEIREKLKTIDH